MEKTGFLLRKGIFVSFSVSTFFSPESFSSPFFTFSFSLSLSCYFVFSLPSFFLLHFASLVLSFSFFSSSLLLFHAKNNIKILNLKVGFSSILSVFWFVVFFFLSIPFPYVCLFSYCSPDFKICFCSTSMFFSFRNCKLENTNVWSRVGLQHNVSFLQTVKVIVFLQYIFRGYISWSK